MKLRLRMGNIAEPRIFRLLVVPVTMRGIPSAFNSFRRKTLQTLEGPGIAVHHGKKRASALRRAP
jgi:hypothetical protein